MPSLFDPIALGAIHAPNRVIMAPLTRGRSSREHVPSALMPVYYSQRASAGLIITEATGISQQGLGWPYAPGIWSEGQIEAWKPVTDAVHNAGGRIMLQLWHMGRVVDPSFNHGAPGASSSATTAPGKAHSYDGRIPYSPARALGIDEIPGIIEDYVRAARNAVAAGFDGVQIHGANGYLIDQFLRDNSNFRDDIYGGSPENRIRLLHEVTTAIAGEIGADRTAVRLSPNGDSQGVVDSNPESVFIPAAQALSDIGIAFLELREPGPDGTYGSTVQPRLSPKIRQVFSGPLILNSDYDATKGQAALDSGVADAISYGRPFISNPDLVARLRTGQELTAINNATLYSNGPEGYIDYPALETVSV